MEFPPRNVENLKKIINDFLKKQSVFDQNACWELRESELGGFGVFATRDIETGQIIFKDCPIIFGPRHFQNCPKTCVTCFSKLNLRGCAKKCGLPLCSEHCEKANIHQKECKLIRQFGENVEISQTLFECLPPIRALFLSNEDKEVVRSLLAHNRPEHGHEIDVLKNELNFDFKEDDEKFLKFVCAVMDANAFEVTVGNEDNQTSLRGLYPLASLANHTCSPNTMHCFDDKQRMITKSTVFIPKNSEIFHSYSRIIWGTTTRQYYLFRTKHFICKCARCMDPTEFGTYMGSILCKKCRGYLVPINPLKGSRWKCQDCNGVFSGKQVGEVLHLLGSVLNSFHKNDFGVMYNFLNGKLKTMVPETNQVVIEIKLKIIWILGYHECFTWKALPLELLRLKEAFCKDVLTVLEKLRVGRCKLRGLMLYEYFCCKREIRSRKENAENIIDNEDIICLEEASHILEFDVTAPLEIKERWNKPEFLI